MIPGAALFFLWIVFRSLCMEISIHEHDWRIMTELYRVAFTGHRPPKIGGYDDSHPLRVAVKVAIREALDRALAKFTSKEIVVITGGALGVDTDAAREAYKMGLRFVVAAPCRNQDRPWPPERQEKYALMCGLTSAELAESLVMGNLYHDQDYPNAAVEGGVVYVYDGPYNRTCMQVRNQWMVDHCDALVAIWDGSSGGTENCVNYAKDQGVPMVRIDPKKLL